ncbi:hypothetical protein H5968_01170 [Sphaerospermopsis sp. LEGE 00249]|uniref:hypothetical protein n=1 Tax=Sphaerospermopsis sp. LEGE 00249 TaxID=1380707 RepID=UPI00164DE684|nr:hypothetical protein [Sphaerospermopsis sp. LEGE 00249]MBC5793796.1 hypothetical protein [Sphaerospermopsis sp. LEGE 00249]
MDLNLQNINLYISESDVVRIIMNQRLQQLKLQEPELKLVFPRGTIAFIWLFMILASFTMLGISVISFYLNLIVISKVYYDFGVFIVCLVLIPLINSWRKYVQNTKKHKNYLHFSKTEAINIVEIENYFSDQKNNFIKTYQEYVNYVHQKIENVRKSQHLSSTTVDEVGSLQNRISQAVDRLETLKNDYFARLDNVELELKNKLIDHISDPEMEVVIESQILVERLEEEVEAINYYLQAVDEMAWK